jgi:hypothetical protein
LSRVTETLDLIEVFAVSATPTVIEFGVGGNSGAVYSPVALIIPVVAVPPAAPFTVHASAGEEPSEACAANCCVSSPCTVALCGVIVSCVCCGGGFPPPPNPPQPAETSAKNPSTARRMRFTASLPPLLTVRRPRQEAQNNPWPSSTLGNYFSCGRTGWSEGMENRKITLLPISTNSGHRAAQPTSVLFHSGNLSGKSNHRTE